MQSGPRWQSSFKHMRTDSVSNHHQETTVPCGTSKSSLKSRIILVTDAGSAIIDLLQVKHVELVVRGLPSHHFKYTSTCTEICPENFRIQIGTNSRPSLVCNPGTMAELTQTMLLCHQYVKPCRPNHQRLPLSPLRRKMFRRSTQRPTGRQADQQHGIKRLLLDSLWRNEFRRSTQRPPGRQQDQQHSLETIRSRQEKLFTTMHSRDSKKL
jgi:hypothetical protein